MPLKDKEPGVHTGVYEYPTFRDPNPKIYTRDDLIDFTRFVWYNKDLKDTSVGIADFLLEWEEKRNKAPGKP